MRRREKMAYRIKDDITICIGQNSLNACIKKDGETLRTTDTVKEVLILDFLKKEGKKDLNDIVNKFPVSAANEREFCKEEIESFLKELADEGILETV
jgi:hypothetical protein